MHKILVFLLCVGWQTCQTRAVSTEYTDGAFRQMVRTQKREPVPDGDDVILSDVQDTAIPEDETIDGGDLTLSNVQDTAASSEDGETAGGDFTLSNVQDTAVSSEEAEYSPHSTDECHKIEPESHYEHGLGCCMKAFIGACSCKHGKDFVERVKGCVNHKMVPGQGGSLVEYEHPLLLEINGTMDWEEHGYEHALLEMDQTTYETKYWEELEKKPCTGKFGHMSKCCGCVRPAKKCCKESWKFVKGVGCELGKKFLKKLVKEKLMR